MCEAPLIEVNLMVARAGSRRPRRSSAVLRKTGGTAFVDNPAFAGSIVYDDLDPQAMDSKARLNARRRRQRLIAGPER